MTLKNIFHKYIFFLILLFIMSNLTNELSAQDDVLDRSKPPLPGPPKDVEFPDYFDTTLPNGINLLVIENNKIPAVSVRLVFKDAGSYHDNDKYGLASMTAEMLTKGTTNRSASTISEEIDFIGGSLSSGSDWDGSYVSLSLLKKHLSSGIEVLSDVVINPVFSDDELSRAKEQRLSSLLQAKDDAGSLSDKMFSKVVFEGMPYGHPAEGTEQSVTNMTRSDLETFYKQNYIAGNLIIAFVGDITVEEAVSITDKYFSKLSTFTTNSESNHQPVELPVTNTVYIVNKPEAVQSNLRIGHVGISRNNPDFIAVSVMNTILGGYFGSRINFNLREKHGFTYGARSYFNPRLVSGDFSVDTDVRSEVTDTSVGLVIEELQRITSEEITDDELQTVKNYLTGVFPLQLETANAVASRVINLKLYNLPKDYYNKYISAINNLTKQDILNAAKKYIYPGNLFIVISGDAGKIKDKLSKFGSVQVYDADGNKLN